MCKPVTLSFVWKACNSSLPSGLFLGDRRGIIDVLRVEISGDASVSSCT